MDGRKERNEGGREGGGNLTWFILEAVESLEFLITGSSLNGSTEDLWRISLFKLTRAQHKGQEWVTFFKTLWCATENPASRLGSVKSTLFCLDLQEPITSQVPALSQEAGVTPRWGLTSEPETTLPWMWVTSVDNPTHGSLAGKTWDTESVAAYSWVTWDTH